MTIAFLNSNPKIPKYGIFGQKYSNKAFLVPNLGIFVSSQNFASRQIQRWWFQIWQKFSKMLIQNTQTRYFWSQIYAFLFFRENLQIGIFWALISNLTIVLPKNTQIKHFWSKIPKNGTFGPKFMDFCFFTKFCNSSPKINK